MCICTGACFLPVGVRLFKILISRYSDVISKESPRGNIKVRVLGSEQWKNNGVLSLNVKHSWGRWYCVSNIVSKTSPPKRQPPPEPKIN